MALGGSLDYFIKILFSRLSARVRVKKEICYFYKIFSLIFENINNNVIQREFTFQAFINRIIGVINFKVIASECRGI